MKAFSTFGVAAALASLAQATSYLGIKSDTYFDDPACTIGVQNAYGCTDQEFLTIGQGCYELEGLHSVDMCSGSAGVNFDQSSQGYPITYIANKGGWCGCYLSSNEHMTDVGVSCSSEC